MKKILVAALMLLPMLSFGQASQGPATIVYPTTAGDCVKIGPLGGGYLADAGAPCGSGSGGVTSFNSRTGAVAPASGDYASFYAAIATTLAGYGITDAYTKTASDARYAALASPTFTGVLTVPQVSVAGNISAPAWTTTGIALHTAAATYTDTTSSGTVASQYVNFLAVPTLAASSAATYTSAYNLLIGGAPAAGANVGITTGYALRVMSGLSRFDGTISAFAGGNFSGATINFNASSSFPLNLGTGTDTAAVNLGGGLNVISVGSHIASTGTAPAVSACGTGTPTIAGTDVKGAVTTGTAATACTLTFASAFASAPVCVAASNTSAVSVAATAVSTTAVTFGLSTALSGVVYYHCLQ